MVETSKVSSYPYIPEKYWWPIRKRFSTALPKQLSTDFLHTVFEASDGTARSLLAGFKLFGLIDDEGRPTELANDWRGDDTYPTACLTMLEATYPQELRDAAPPGQAQKATVERWIARTLKLGKDAARQQAATYVLLSEGDLTRAAVDHTTGNASLAPRPKAVIRRPPAEVTQAVSAIPDVGKSSAADANHRIASLVGGLAINLNLQLTLPESTDPAVYDALFSSLRRHLLDA